MILVTGHRGFVGTHLCRTLGEWVGIDLVEGQDILTCDLPDADRVYHLAARTDAQSPDASGDAEVNVMGTLRLLERYRERVVFASSSMVSYPVTPYGISKLAGEHYARMFGAAVVRFCNLYGEGGHSVIDRFREGEVVIRGTGEQVRTYAPVEDAVRQLLSIRPGETHILQGRDMTVNEVALMFPHKRVRHVPASDLDLLDARQEVA